MIAARSKATLAFGAGKPKWWISQDAATFSAGFRPNETFEFVAIPSAEVELGVLDYDGKTCMASLLIRDTQDHVYPPQTMRLAPDMAFHPHIYRADGESIRLPEGEYEVEAWRGPEYLRIKKKVQISYASPRVGVRLQRWIDPRNWGWYSGNTHIHAAGCAHYTFPTEGVSPESMIRHVRGGALSIAEVLNWAPGWSHQRQFFSGHTEHPPPTLEYPALQEAASATWKPRSTPKDDESTLRYDVEVSGFPSSMSGRLVLLRLKEPDYPGTQNIEDWPSWNLPILKWAKAQGGVVGFAHGGLGMQTASVDLPNYEIPFFNSIGHNEAIVDVTHDACDFLSGCDSGLPVADLNTWYHMLSCGFQLAMVGETDYPCMFDERPGVGRSYVQLDQRPACDAGYESWIEGIRAGRLYFGDGRSHFLKYRLNGHALGRGPVALEKPAGVHVEALVAARLEASGGVEQPTLRETWHIERARIGTSRKVPVELIVNGRPVKRLEILADGEPRPVAFKTLIERSSWVALRILPSGHTHPIFVTVGSKPIRASRSSAEWLRKCVDALWQEKHRLIRDSERAAAAEAYDHARRTYNRIIAESDVA